MKKNFLFIFSLTITIICNGQNKDYSVIKSRVFIEPFVKTKLIKSIEDNEGGIYTIRYYDEFVSMQYNHSNSKGFIIQHWDSLQNSLSYNNYKIETDKKGVLSGISINQNKLHVLEYVQNKREKTIDCFVHISLDNRNEFERKKIFSVDVKRFPGFIYSALNDKIDNNYQGNMEFSPNSEYIVFHIDSDTKDDEKHKLHVLNSKLETVWEKEFTHTEKDKLFDIENVKIDNNGEVYILGKVFHNKRKNEIKDNINYHFEVFKVTKDKTESTLLNLENNLVNTINLKLNEDQVYCIGLFSEKNDLNLIDIIIGKDIITGKYEDKYKITGTAFFSIDKLSMKIIKSNFQKLSSEFIENKYDTKGYKGTGQYLIKNIEPLKDSGYIIIAEEFFIESSMHYGMAGMGATSSVSYNFNDIVTIRLNEFGDLIWAKNINKHQLGYSNNDKLVSCSAFVNNDKTYMFFNERKNIKPIENNLNFEHGNFGNITEKNSNLYAVKIDGDGKISCDAIHLNKYNDIIFYPVNGSSSYNSQMVIFGSNEKQKQFLTFKLK